jgi:hypothetical protein
MDNLRNMFTLGGSGQQAGGRGSPLPRRATTDTDEQSWEQLGSGDDGSAPYVAGQFARPGGGVQFDQQEGRSNIFTLGRETVQPAPLAEITQPWGETRKRPLDPPGAFRPGGIATGSPPQPQGAPPPTAAYSGLAAAITRWKTTDTAAIGRELEWQ